MQRPVFSSVAVGALLWLCLAAASSGDAIREEDTVGPGTLDARLAGAEWVDLTHSFDEQTIYWPTASGFELQRGPAGYTDKGFYYVANGFAAAEHGGTHIDSPIHFFEDGDTVDEIPLRRLIGAAVVVDVSARCLGNPDYQISVADLTRWEKEQEHDLSDKLVLLRTGWGAYWPDRGRYLGTAELGAGAVARLHFPGLHPAAARWLVEHRAVRAVGIDTASIDFGQSQLFESHVALFAHGVPVFENVANLDTLAAHGFLVIALPMKIGGGSGGPLRIVAMLPADGELQ